MNKYSSYKTNQPKLHSTDFLSCVFFSLTEHKIEFLCKLSRKFGKSIRSCYCKKFV
jgi:hypothetical protein